MKTTIKVLTTAVILFLETANLIAVSKISDTSAFVLNGVIINLQKILTANAKCKIQIFEENTLVDSIQVRSQKSFEIKAKKNSWYTLKITNENTIPIMISFDTRTGNSKIKNNTFFFKVELLSTKKIDKINKDIIEFPIGHASFNCTKGVIEIRKNYSKFYYTHLYKLD